MSEERLDFLGLEGNGAVRSMLFKLGQNSPQLEQIVFSDHVTKINRRDKEQVRVLLITTRAIYNLLPTNYSKCKRRIPVTLLSSITVSQLSDEFVLHIPDEYDYRFKSGKRDKIAEVINRMYKRMRDEEAAGKPQPASPLEHKEPASPTGRKAKSKLHVQYVNESDLSSITLTKQQARMQSREDILRRKQELIVEVGDNDSDAENESNNNDDSNGDGSTGSGHEQKTMEVEQLLNNTDKVRLEDFELLKVLGRGSFGKVMLVRYKRDGKKYAMKILKKKAIIARNQVEHTKAERKILESLQHPFLMTLRFAFQSTEKLYFVLDYYQGGELFFHLKNQRRFPESIARLFVAEIALALGHLHSLGVVYRDLKPENILLDDLGHVCLTDFGLSKDLEYSDKSHTFCGTPEYLAPEIVAGLGHNQAVDWWSLGILLYELTVGIPPFYSTNVNEMYNKIQHGVLRFPPFLSDDCKNVIVGLLNRDPTKRLGASERDVEDIKAMPFFNKMPWDVLMRKEIDSPYRQHCLSSEEAANFDTTFTNEPVVDSVVTHSSLLAGSLQSRNGLNENGEEVDTFRDFSYVPGKGEGLLSR